MTNRYDPVWYDSENLNINKPKQVREVLDRFKVLTRHMNRQFFYFSLKAERRQIDGSDMILCSFIATNLGNPTKFYEETFQVPVKRTYRNSIVPTENPAWTDSLYEKFSLWRFLAENNIYTPKTYAQKRKQEQLDEESARYVESLMKELK